MNIENYQVLTEEQADLLMKILFIHQKEKEALTQMYHQEVKAKSFICRVLEKRIAAFKTAPFEPSALIFIDLLSDGNPGRAILMMIETLEAYDKEGPMKPSIDIDFIAGQVYPWGFYTQAIFEKEFDARKENPVGYNVLI